MSDEVAGLPELFDDAGRREALADGAEGEVRIEAEYLLVAGLKP
jgi:hypothetical protein